MRIVDVVHDSEDRFAKHLLVEDGGTFAILDQIAGNRPTTARATLTGDTAMHLWQSILEGAFYAVTHNATDSKALATKRVATLH